jgi:FKBP-type peptidyl-prolyl cis-trans isomerase FklB
MRKLTLLALVLVAGAIATPAAAKKKKDKKKPAVEQLQPVQLLTGSDSVSYAAGVNATEGLLPFLQQQMHVDTAYMDDFIRGLNEALAMKDDPRQTAFRAGQNIAEQLQQRMLPGMKRDFTDTPDSLSENLFFQGFLHALRGDTAHFSSTQASSKYFQMKQKQNREAKTERLYGDNRRQGEQFLADNAKKEGVVTLPSGLQYKVLTQGTGPTPKATDKVQVHYEGRLVDGTVFDASKKHGDKPATFEANRVIKGWTEALTLMPVGSKWQLYIPYNLAYGERDMGNIKPFSALIFDVELIGIE